MSDGGDLRSRLARLRRDRAEPRPSADRGSALPAWVGRSLSRRGERSGAAELGAAGARRVGPPGGLSPVETPQGSFAERVARLTAEHRHGEWRLDDVDHAAADVFPLVARDPALARLDLRGAVYLDIETTGLSGGAGTTAFLVALGTFEGDAFHLWQGFLPGPEGERALLSEVARRVAAKSALVSFFGKSFDRHRLEDKMRVHGVEPPFSDLPHLDLYHPLARLYRPAFPDGRLGTMERGLCGVARVDDLSGRHAPEAWFDFLAGRAHLLEEVFRHNADDVLSLVVLAAHLGRTLEERRPDGAPLAGPGRTRAASLARLFAERREREEALRWIEHALARRPEDPDDEERELRYLQGELLRRDGEPAAALDAFASVCDGRRDELSLRAWISVAKLAEHRLKDRARALDAVARARAILETGAVLTPRGRRYLDDVTRREERLRARVGPG